MKKLTALLLTLSLLCLCGAAFAQDAAVTEEPAAEAFRFESLRGAALEDIEALEGDDYELLELDYQSGENSPMNLCYKDREYYGKAAVICYVIGSGGLKEANVYLDEQHESGAEFVADYEDIKAELIEIYGAPMMDMVNSVTGQSFTDDADMSARGAALLDGSASWLTLWMDGTENKIYMGMSADANDATTRVQFSFLTVAE